MPGTETAETSQLASRSLGRDLAATSEEVLRLRDLLIARDAELGAARGRWP